MTFKHGAWFTHSGDDEFKGRVCVKQKAGGWAVIREAEVIGGLAKGFCSLAHGDEPSTSTKNDIDENSEDCRRCGGKNVVWSAASPLWNFVMRENDINGPIKYADLVCIPCFITLAIEKGLPVVGWRLTLVPEPEGLIYETPSGRVWDPEKFLWVKKEEQ